MNQPIPRQPKPRRLWQPSRMAAAVAALPLLLSGCLGEDEPEPLAVLPAGITELGATAYTATTPGTGTKPATSTEAEMGTRIGRV